MSEALRNAIIVTPHINYT